jgi:hypothetical protein
LNDNVSLFCGLVEPRGKQHEQRSKLAVSAGQALHHE